MRGRNLIGFIIVIIGTVIIMASAGPIVVMIYTNPPDEPVGFFALHSMLHSMLFDGGVVVVLIGLLVARAISSLRNTNDQHDAVADDVRRTP